MPTLHPGRAFLDRGLAGDGSRTLAALDGGAPVVIPAPVGPPPPPPVAMYVGASINGQSAAQLTKLETQLGQTLGVLRMYDSNFPATWGGSAGSQGGNRPVVISMKPDVVAMGNGSLDSQYQTILNGAPKGRRIYWVLGQHEPDVKINKGLYTVAQWKAAALRMGNMVKAMNVAAWRCCIITTAQPWDSGHAYDENSFWLPGVSDIWTIDKFNPNSNPAVNPYKPLSNFISKAVTWFVANSIPWGVTETNTYEDFSDLTKKSSWMTTAASYLNNNGAELVTYWDEAFGSDPDQTARRIQSSQPSINAWANAIAKYNPS